MGKTPSKSKSPREELIRIAKREELWKLDGPAPTEDKLLWKQLALRNLQRRHIPPFLRNEVLYQTKKDPLFGRIQVKRMTGLTGGPATAIVRKFEGILEGREDLEEKLLAVEDKLGDDEKRLLELLKGKKNKSLATLFAEASVKPSKVLKLYAEGALALGKVQAAIQVSKEQPQVVKDLMRHALDQEKVCKTCVGTGKVKEKTTSTKETQECPSCHGSGYRLASSKHKQFAMGKVLELGKLIDSPAKGASVNVSQNVGVGIKVSGGGGFMEKILRTSDEVLYGRRIVDVEGEVRDAEKSAGSLEAGVPGVGAD
jgi:hypothetical protein